jgi:hypothetical protein
MTSAQLEHAQKRMQQKWFDLAMAEQRGVSTAVLERMYNAYILAVEEYNRCSAEYQHEQEQQVANEPIPVPQRKASRSTYTQPLAEEGHTKLAS